ncbi:MAG: archaemetzincin family Zn-dependent metalloprotease [Thaumarchaeota archaeon]|jgi:archaemetzincin|nr:archaemetzincin family Zn-dependent metalloprotease [Candidatus Terraquivivens yellowstonensis]MCL7397782.1 archaemetzincin family Zn-dependent metalloprotease [Candidatus Terraquivivens yellowstonensis]MCL7399988.1 archaemetzincin family Zn-dependent metalloprotease [Candidatus Terraquivivens yellowstonensis]
MRRLRIIQSKYLGRIAEIVAGRLKEVYGLDVVVDEKTFNVTPYSFNALRRQHNAVSIAEVLSKMKMNDELLLALVDVDTYAPGLNYCFGIALKDVAVVSTYRLDPRFYGLPYDESLYHERIIKEACHEVGHLLGLQHCDNPKCVMHFSNWIHDTDVKGYMPCARCISKLR